MRQFLPGDGHMVVGGAIISKASIIGKYNHMVQGDPHPLYIFTLCFYPNNMAHGLPTCPGPFVLYRCIVIALPMMCIPDNNDRGTNLNSLVLVI